MSLSIVVDMNLSAEWVPFLTAEGWATVHWSQVGDPRATDLEIMTWARTNQSSVFTHDLDFTTILALTHSFGPSVIQLRSQDILPDYLGGLVVTAIRNHRTELEQGAILVVDLVRSRIRILPI